MLFVSHSDVENLLDATEVLRVCEEAVREAAEDTVRWSQPRLLKLDPTPLLPARLRIKTCALDAQRVIGTRLSLITPGSPSTDAPTRVVLLNDPVTGAFIGMVDERWSFAVRTGASAALALRYLAPPQTDTVGIVGLGQVGKGTAFVLPAALPVRRLIVTDPSPAATESFIDFVRQSGGPDVIVASSVEEVFASADTVVLATTSPNPFVRTAWLRPGCTVCSLGGEPELDLDAYTEVDRLVVDDWEAVRTKRDMRELVERGLMDEARIDANFVQLMTGGRAGRQNSSERIVVRSEGLAIMDTALAYHLSQKAEQQGLGQRVG